MSAALLSLAPRDVPVAVLLRHAERPVIAAGTTGGDLALTDAGQTSAAALGRELSPVLRDIHTSPVRRARETAEAMRAGAGLREAARVDPVLGDPGVFVADAEAAWAEWLRRGADAVLADLAAGRTLPGLHDMEAASRRLVAHLLAIDRPGVRASVTHDVLMIPLLAWAWRRPLPREEWPGFLDAAALWRVGTGAALAYRGRVAQLAW